MITRLMVALDHGESAALRAMSETDCRPLREQLRYLLRAEAQRRGILTAPHQGVVTEQIEGASTDQDDAPLREA